MTEEVTDVPFTEDDVALIRAIMRANEIGEAQYGDTQAYREFMLYPSGETEFTQLDLPGGFSIQKLSNGTYAVSMFEQRGGTSYENPPYDEETFSCEDSTNITDALKVYFREYMALIFDGVAESYFLQKEHQECERCGGTRVEPAVITHDAGDGEGEDRPCSACSS